MFFLKQSPWVSDQHLVRSLSIQLEPFKRPRQQDSHKTHRRLSSTRNFVALHLSLCGCEILLGFIHLRLPCASWLCLCQKTFFSVVQAITCNSVTGTFFSRSLLLLSQRKKKKEIFMTMKSRKWGKFWGGGAFFPSRFFIANVESCEWMNRWLVAEVIHWHLILCYTFCALHRRENLIREAMREGWNLRA